ncbi:isoprenyl transferase [bacterium]|nr:MAG: isoprenyl transferase [bacterium]
MSARNTDKSSRKSVFDAFTRNFSKSKKEKLLAEVQEAGNLPRHIAIIMDGNGRWAKERGMPRIAGHNQGVKSVKEIVEACGELGIEALTLYAFSQENWKRPTWEVSALMKLLMRTINNEIDNLNSNNVRIKTIGHIELLPPETLKQVQTAINITKSNTGLVLNLALSYSARIEIMDAVKKIAKNIIQNSINFEKIDEDFFSKNLDTWDLPDPDLVIRTSGEYRISNFLLWQIAYSEIYITDTYWPDFRKPQLYEAIRNYQKRERRFGKVSEQVNVEKKHAKKTIHGKK